MNEPDLRFFSRKLLTSYQPDSLKTLSGGVVMGFTFSLKMVPRSWYQDLGTKILVPRSGTKILARPGMARHGNIWHGTDPQSTARKSAASRTGGTGVFLTRHGTSESSESPESERL